MTNLDMFKEMFRIQENLNVIVSGVKWREQHYPWHRAIWLECAELIEHLGWKWWKANKHDRNQVLLEVVDIWHFGLSSQLQDQLIQEFQEYIESYDSIKPLPRLSVSWAEQIALHALDAQEFDYDAFFHLLSSLGVSLQELYNLYIAKATLNRFRQHCGYASGTYQKNWGGKEDNQVLSEYLDANKDKAIIDANLYFWLTNEYLTRTEGHCKGCYLYVPKQSKKAYSKANCTRSDECSRYKKIN